MVDTKQTARDFALQIFADQQAGKFVAEAAKPLADYLEALRAAVPEEGPVAVKPLEWQRSSKWEPGEFVTEWWADSVAGTYRVWCDPTVDPNCWHVEYPGRPFEGSGRPGIEAAKAAAQADYEQRIHSTLVSAPRPDMERELAEARAEIAILMNMRHRIAERQITLITERDALTADKVRLAESVHDAESLLSVIAEDAQKAGDIATWSMASVMAEKLHAALSGASIPFAAMPTRERMREKIANSPDDDECEVRPAPDKAEARRDALEEAAETPQEIFGRWLSDGPRLAKEAGLYVGINVMPAISNPARREGE